MTLIADEILNSRTQKKKVVREMSKKSSETDPPTSNKVNELKHCLKLMGSAFTIFIGHSEGNSVGQSPSWWYGKYLVCLLTHWLPMTSILFLKEPIYCNSSRYNNLRNKQLFLNFFSHFRNLHSIVNIFEKKMTLRADVFLNLRTPENLVRQMSKKSHFRRPFDK